MTVADVQLEVELEVVLGLSVGEGDGEGSVPPPDTGSSPPTGGEAQLSTKGMGMQGKKNGGSVGKIGKVQRTNGIGRGNQMTIG